MTVALIPCPGTAAEARHLEGRLPSGASYVADTPGDWNGVLLLYSHGYTAGPANPAADAPDELVRQLLLDRGYALVGSSYARAGWALAEASPDQLAALSAYQHAVRKPRRVIAWGHSMGGLITLQLIEQSPRVDGGVALCGSVAGALNMMNTALNGALAFRTLVPEAAGLQIQGAADDRALSARVRAIAEAQAATAEGRARLALVAALAGMAGTTPNPTAIAMGVFLPRADQTRRAGGDFSWTTGVDFRRTLVESGQAPAVEALYAAAGKSLQSDLDRLAAAQPEVANAGAVAYMRAHYTPTGALRRPMLSIHTTDDDLTTPAMQDGLRRLVDAAGRGRLLRQAFVDRPGHCAFTAGEQVAAIQALERRLEDGRWTGMDPDRLNGEAKAVDGRAAAFIAYTPPRLPRLCPAGRPCTGEPAKAGHDAARAVSQR